MTPVVTGVKVKYNNVEYEDGDNIPLNCTFGGSTVSVGTPDTIDIIIEGEGVSQSFEPNFSCDDETGVWSTWLSLVFNGNTGTFAGGFVTTGTTPDPDTATLVITSDDSGAGGTPVTATFTIKPNYE